METQTWRCLCLLQVVLFPLMSDASTVKNQSLWMSGLTNASVQTSPSKDQPTLPTLKLPLNARHYRRSCGVATVEKLVTLGQELEKDKLGQTHNNQQRKKSDSNTLLPFLPFWTLDLQTDWLTYNYGTASKYQKPVDGYSLRPGKWKSGAPSGMDWCGDMPAWKNMVNTYVSSATGILCSAGIGICLFQWQARR